MFLTTTDNITGYQISENLGIVRGNTVRAKWFGADFVSGLKNLVGGEMTQYVKLLTEAREQAMKRMKDDAEKLKADAIINVRFMTSQIAQTAAEILVYGTAVKLKKK